MSYTHDFSGNWLIIKNEKSHYLCFRKAFEIYSFNKADFYICSNSFYRLFVNGLPVCTKTELSDKTDIKYDRFDITDYLMDGENLIALLTFCPSDFENLNLICDLEVDNKNVICSDNSFLYSTHSGVTTKYLPSVDVWIENYNSNCFESEFEYPDYDDSAWRNASTFSAANRTLAKNSVEVACSKPIKPKSIKKTNRGILVDFGETYIGQIYAEATGKKDDEISLVYSQNILEKWTLSGGYDVFNNLMCKKISKVEFIIPNGTTIDTESITLISYK